jgi:hypothetical protein
MPALHIETAVREISKNVVRMVECMWMPDVSSLALSGPESPFWLKNGQKYTPTPTAFWGIKTRQSALSFSRGVPVWVVLVVWTAPEVRPSPQKTALLAWSYELRC